MEIIALTPARGAVLNAGQVIGRDQELEVITEALLKQGVNINAVRRFGKSSILVKLKYELERNEKFRIIYLEVEGINTCDSFIDKLYRSFIKEKFIKENSVKKIDKAFNALIDRIKKVGVNSLLELELNERKQIWTDKIEMLLNAVIERGSDKINVICLDEFSIMLDSIEDKREAIALIGILRAIVHEPEFKDNIRFIYCGSIGIDLVLDKLKVLDGNIGEPLNHLFHFELQPLTRDNAIFLCRCFMKGCSLHLTDQCIYYIVDKCDFIPYYIDSIFSLIRYKKSLSLEDINQAYMMLVDDSNEKYEFSHFFERIDLYYPNKSISFSILNILSRQSDIMSETDIYIAINPDESISRMECIKELDRLRKDEYIVRQIKDNERWFKFKYGVVKDWWNTNKSY